MEEIILNIDSRYRNIIQFPDESKFRVNLEKGYKNIISVKVVTSEINNNVSLISSKKNNNWFTIYLPNKLNDPDGTKIEINDNIQDCEILNEINKLLNNLFNNNNKLSTLSIDNKIFAEKYFYFFYLINKINISFSFNNYNDINNSYSFLRTPLTINEGWNSVYGLYIQINNYVKNNYETYIREYNKKGSGDKYDLYYGYFDMAGFTLNIYDRRERNTNINLDCIRNDSIDAFTGITNIATNLINIKNSIYNTYINDLSTFIAVSSGTNLPILDRLMGESSQSKYYINNIATFPSSLSTQTYNLCLQHNEPVLSFISSFNIDYVYFYVNSTSNANIGIWNNENNNVINLLDKSYLYQENFITESQFNNQKFIPTLLKDIPSFEIDFNTIYSNPIDNGYLNINKLNYQPLGYYLGFRPKIDNFLLSSITINNCNIIKGKTYYKFTDTDYIFIKINDWGYINFFNQTLFTKVILNPELINYDKSNREYKFRQPINIQKLEIELVDYLGNTVDMNGYDYSFSLQLIQIINTDQKFLLEKESRIFMK
jgi:hypothetical protein